MPTDPARRRLGVRFDERIWSDATRGFSGQALDTARSGRRSLEDDGVALAELLPCESPGPSVYERAHRRLHGKFRDRS